MCGRFVAASPPGVIAEYFSATPPPADLVPVGADLGYEPNYNVAPTTDVLGIVERGGGRECAYFYWGLLPPWADSLKVGARMINARAETLSTSGAFKRAFAQRRCLIAADGFYEWEKLSGSRRKQPYFIHRPDGEPYAFAGIWERWRGEIAGESVTVQSVSIVTTTPNAVIAKIHDRMPVVVSPKDWERWLDPTMHDTDALQRILVPAPDELFELRPVSEAVNNARNTGPRLLDRVDPPEEPVQISLL
jgi:putative SOS response-associated peptidase YedK